MFQQILILLLVSSFTMNLFFEKDFTVVTLASVTRLYLSGVECWRAVLCTVGTHCQSAVKGRICFLGGRIQVIFEFS